jgi:hypothetical protein
MAARRGDQRRVNNGQLAHHPTLFGQVSIDRSEDLTSQFFGLAQVSKLEQRRRVWSRLAGQIDANENSIGLAVVDCMSNAFLRQAETLLGYIHAQHAC